MEYLVAHGVPVGVQVSDFIMSVDTACGVQVDYASSYLSSVEDLSHSLGEEDLRLLVVMRDANGTLRGALPGADFAAVAPGDRHQRGSVRLSQWPSEADPDISEVATVRVCCGWVG